MKDEISNEEARDIWNSPAPEIDRNRLNRAYGSINGYIIRTRLSAGIRYGAYGAVAACLMAVGVFIGRSSTHQDDIAESVSEYVEYVAGTGETEEFLLADGTRVYLNSQSYLNCENSLSGPTRDVFLCGEAFFEVAKDSLHPFIVHASGTRIKVTGTKFNVRAFPDEDTSTTTLIEGGVEVSVPGQSNPITLVPGTALTVSCTDRSASLFEVDADDAIGWYRGEFNAYHLTLEQICRNLERRFGVKFYIENERIASKVFYASFVNNEDVDGILKSLNVNKDFRIRKQNDGLYILY